MTDSDRLQHDEAHAVIASGGDLWRPVETLTTTLDAPLEPDAFEHQGRKPCTPIPCSPAEPE